MRRLVSITLLLLLAPFARPCAAALECAAPQQSYLRVAGDPALRTTYAIRNTGGTPLTIRKITTNCSCTIATADKPSYAPGETGAIRVDYAYGTKTGPHVKVIRIDCDDGSTLSLAISVTVIPPPLEAAPKFVWWKTGEPPATKSVTLRNTGGTPIRVTTAACSDPRLAAKVVTLQAGIAYRIDITPTDTSAKLKAVVTVQSDYPTDLPRAYTIDARIK